MLRRSVPRVSWVLLIVVVAALGTGAAASILVASSSAPPPASGPSSLVFLPYWAIELASVGVLVFVVATMVLWGLQSQRSPVLNRMAVVVLVAILIGVLFILAAHLLGFGGPLSASGGSQGNSSSGSGTGGSGGKNLTGPGGTIVPVPGLPGWVSFAALAVVAVLVVVIVVPSVRGYLEDRRREGVHRTAAKETVPSGVRDALERASAELESGADPRAVILALYAALLTRLQPMVGDIDSSTPEEIRAGHLVRLGVRPAAAHTLTRLFEEARYSTHPMGPQEGTRAREAVRESLDDLDRRNFAA